MSPPASATKATEQVAIARRAGLLGAGTLASRILGAMRDSVIAASFPLALTDAFFVAFTIPNALRVLLGEGAVSAAFVPVYTEVREKEGPEQARVFFAKLRGLMLLVLACVTALGVAFAPWIVPLYAAGYASDPAKLSATVQLTRLVFPYIFLMGTGALGMAALNAERRFFVPAFAPGLLNVAMIAAPFAFVPVAVALGLQPISALAIGALVGGVLQVVAQWPALAKIGLFARPRIDLRDPYVRKAMKLLGPLLVGVGIYQLNVLLSRQFASFLPDGSQSYLYYAQRVVEIPQGMFALALATATLPSLAASRNRGDADETRRIFSYAMRLSSFVAVPSSIALVVLAEPTITVLFARGTFARPEVLETTRSLMWQASGIWAVSAVRTVVPMFHAHNDTRSPVIGSATNLVAFVGTSLALMGALKHVALAVALSAGSLAQLVVLLVLLRRRVGRVGLGSVVRAGAKTLLASLAMAAVAFGVTRAGDWTRGGNDLRSIAIYVVAVGAGGLTYLGAAWLLRAQELSELRAAFARRRARSGGRAADSRA